MLNRLRRTVPYVGVLVATGVLFVFANRISFIAPGGRIGPDVWPKAILGLAMLTCVFQIVKTLFFGATGEQVAGVLESIIEKAPAGESAARSGIRRAPPPVVR